MHGSRRRRDRRESAPWPPIAVSPRAVAGRGRCGTAPGSRALRRQRDWLSKPTGTPTVRPSGTSARRRETLWLNAQQLTAARGLAPLRRGAGETARAPTARRRERPRQAPSPRRVAPRVLPVPRVPAAHVAAARTPAPSRARQRRASRGRARRRRLGLPRRRGEPARSAELLSAWSSRRLRRAPRWPGSRVPWLRRGR